MVFVYETVPIVFVIVPTAATTTSALDIVRDALLPSVGSAETVLTCNAPLGSATTLITSALLAVPLCAVIAGN